MSTIPSSLSLSSTLHYLARNLACHHSPLAAHVFLEIKCGNQLQQPRKLETWAFFGVESWTETERDECCAHKVTKWRQGKYSKMVGIKLHFSYI